jgi:hypothetical protein
MFSLRKMKGMAGVAAAVLILAQAVYAADACVSSAAATTRGAAAMKDMPDCTQMKSEASCLAQCSAGDQRAATPVVTLPDAPASHALVAPLSQAEQLVRVACGTSSRACDPPPPIRFCTFLL